MTPLVCLYVSSRSSDRVSCCILIIINFCFLEQKRLKWVEQQSCWQSFRAMLNIVQASLVKLLSEIRAGSWTAWCNMPPKCISSYHFSPHTLLIQTHRPTLSWAFLTLIIQTHESPNFLCLEGVSPSSFLFTRKLMEHTFVEWTTSLTIQALPPRFVMQTNCQDKPLFSI